MKLGQKDSALRARRTVLSAALMATVAIGPMVVAPAAYAQAASERSFNIQPQSLADALVAFASQSGYQVTTNGAEIRGVRTNGVKATLPSAQALNQILAGTGFTYRINGNVVTIERAPESADGSAVQLGPVRVEGRTGGAGGSGGNGLGSSDVTATENSGSYTTRAMSVATKLPTSIRETPRVVSVITNQQLKDQGLTGQNLEETLRYAPGITLDDTPSVNGGGINGSALPEGMPRIYSRGQQVTSLQIDGITYDLSGAPGQTNNSSAGYYNQTASGLLAFPDMNLYDHIEIVRGPNSVFAGNGNPSATVNMVRKRPLDHLQVNLEGSFGSWDGDLGDIRRRLTADITSPIALDGRLRVRAIASHQDGSMSFQDHHESERYTLYGVVEFAPSDNSRIGIGYSKEESETTGNPLQSGLPRYISGADIGLPVSFNITHRSVYADVDSENIIGYIEHRFANDWLLKINASRLNQSQEQQFIYIQSNIYENGSGLYMGQSLTDGDAHKTSKQTALDINLSGTTRALGADITFLAGADYKKHDGLYYLIGQNNGGRTRVPVKNIFDYDWMMDLAPQNMDIYPYRSDRVTKTTETGIYASAKIGVTDKLGFILSGRWAKYEYNQYQVGGYSEGRIQTYSARSKSIQPITPTFALTYDVAKSLTTYVSYSESYRDQSGLREGKLKDQSLSGYVREEDIEIGERLRPMRGRNYEFGIKGEFLDGRLNAAATLYHMTRRNMAYGDFYNENGELFYTVGSGTGLSDLTDCCYLAIGKERSQGIDIELSGQLFPGLQMTAGYTYNDNKTILGGGLYNLDGGYTSRSRHTHSRTPKHLLKFWGSYQPQGGALRDFRFGVGVIAQSRSFADGDEPEYLGYDADYVWTDPSSGLPTGEIGRPVYSNEWYYAGGAGRNLGFNTTGTTYTLPYEFEQKPYAIVNAMIDWQVTSNVGVQLNVDNLFDKKYYRTIGTSTGGNFYGAPRYVGLTLRVGI